jgi:hypothetical protein
VIDDPELVAELNASINLVGDQRWTEDHWTSVATQLGVLALDDVLEPLGTLVSDLVLEDASLRESAVIALARARSDWEDAERALRLRADLKLDGLTASRDLADERDVAQHLLQALEAPIVEWAGAALVFLTAEGAFK